MAAEVKIIVIGDTNVGKTCLLLTYTTNAFPETYVPTVFDNYTAPISIDGRSIQMNLWDTSGSDDLDEMRPVSYAGSDCFMICFAVSEEESFERIKTKWVPEIVAHCGVPNPRIVIVGTKSDIRDNAKSVDILAKQGKQLVKKESIESMANEVNALGFTECSAVNQNGLNEAFEMTARVALGMEDGKEKDKDKKGKKDDKKDKKAQKEKEKKEKEEKKKREKEEKKKEGKGEKHGLFGFLKK
ncbi:Rho GTPase, putative [Entamoeba invadens IP1]|uniref:small monomeric GTPase n=2 Tax=Entamoeba invadens TaxID=33085 RepID=A0A0A1UDQ3_ENTIV|nr:Rho GTPase, putative [Entamoeba invadens IP1]XP_004261495.1 Rho GTPase, putative [Entamoeba invadens IP1]BAN40514.1 GTPase_rho, putative [Entamoeba invadens]ELP94719.1 Rho GTPase, putative [Entamoeba invadens IP1]ELP94724.1 Rho GTPase, putative [Entamoeba invadens IP1]BAN41122.1 GTPase_rho, putative [Entamoeba invadens]|eukprot:XP_004261490.1 Rho GTPase, putative [Entamoeba invadens IP1]